MDDLQPPPDVAAVLDKIWTPESPSSITSAPQPDSIGKTGHGVQQVTGSHLEGASSLPLANSRSSTPDAPLQTSESTSANKLNQPYSTSVQPTRTESPLPASSPEIFYDDWEATPSRRSLDKDLRDTEIEACSSGTDHSATEQRSSDPEPVLSTSFKILNTVGAQPGADGNNLRGISVEAYTGLVSKPPDIQPQLVDVVSGPPTSCTSHAEGTNLPTIPVLV